MHHLGVKVGFAGMSVLSVCVVRQHLLFPNLLRQLFQDCYWGGSRNLVLYAALVLFIEFVKATLHRYDVRRNDGDVRPSDSRRSLLLCVV